MKIDRIIFAVSAVITNKSGNVLILKRSNTRTYNNYWQLPEGKLEQNENPNQALLREIYEELGVKIKTSKFIDINHNTIRIENDNCLVIRMIFTTKLRRMNNFALSHEHMAYRWFNPNKPTKLKLAPGVLNAIKRTY